MYTVRLTINIYGSSFETQPLAHWNLISYTMTVQHPVLSPSSTLLLSSSRYACIRARQKNMARFLTILLLYCYTF